MRSINPTIAHILSVLFFFGVGLSYGQGVNLGCPNADFSFGSFTNWVGSMGTHNPLGSINITQFNTINPGRHTIMNPGTDPIAPSLNTVPPGYQHSARIGNSGIWAEVDRLSYTFVVSPQNTLFEYQWAAVMDAPLGHPPNIRPKLQIQVRDQFGQPVPCTFLDYVPQANNSGWNTITFGPNNVKNWKDWTVSALDLSGLIGQNVTIEVTTADCALGGHFAYAYLVARCRPLQIDLNYCQGDTTAVLSAPAGFTNYLWSNGDTTQSVTLQNPPPNQAPWTVTLTSETGCTATLSANIHPIVPIAHFGYSNLCNKAVQFLDSTAIPNSYASYWSWDFGDGQSSNAQNPTHQYQQSGTYNVTLIAQNLAGCGDTVTLPITVAPDIQADFVVDSLCGLSKQFTDSTSISGPGSVAQWFWDFGDGNTSTLQNPVHMYTSPGTYNVILRVTDGFGCSDSIFRQILVYAIPNAAFSFQTACPGNNIPFSNQSSIQGWGGMSYQWDFGNGGSSFQHSPWYAFQQSGSYNVSLIANGPGGCADTATQLVNIHPVPQASFSLPPPCGLSGQITNTSTIANPGVITGYQWNLGNGQTSNQQNPSFNYNTPGTYTLSLTVTSSHGCVDSETQSFTVAPSLQAQFSAPQTCFGNAVAFNNTSVGQGGGNLSYTWDFGNGQSSNQQSPNYTYPQPGNYNVSLVVSEPNGCTDTAHQVVVVHTGPTASFTMPDSCGLNGTFLSTGNVGQPGNPNTYHWDLGNGQTQNTQNASYNYQTPGTYTITHAVTSPDGCTDTVSQNFTVFSIPQAAFSGPQTCHGNAVPFQDQSTIQNSQITQWAWSFGNGQIGTTQNPVYNYPQHGQYNVTLVVTGVGGCTDTVTNQVNISPTPIAAFSLPDSCGLTNAFSNLSSIAQPGTITSHQWNFGNGQSSSQQDPIHQFTNPGTYNVSLIVSSNEGCTDTLVQAFSTWAIPQAAFNHPQVCDQTSVPFNDQSTIQNSSIATWQWDFGDGNSSTQQNPSHIYGTHGQYNLSLVVTGLGGCADTATAPLTVSPTPVSNFSLPPSCGMTANFTGQATVAPPSNISGWNWSFGDGNSGSGNAPTHTYATNGTYNVSLVVTTSQGCTDTTTLPYTNHHWPSASFSAPNTCDGLATPFSDNSTVQNDQITQWQWTTGDGGSYNSNTFNHVYAGPGAYPVSLIVSSANGCSDTVTGLTNVWVVPTADFSFQNACSGVPVSFQNMSTISGGAISGNEWDFGAGGLANSTMENPVVQFSNDGSFQVSLVVSSSEGCTDSISDLVSIHPRPRLSFSATPLTGCAPLQVVFENETTIPAGNTIASYTWDLGLGTTTNVEHPSQWYMNPGLYTVTLHAVSDKGCDSTILLPQMIEAYALPDAQFSFTPSELTVVDRSIVCTNQSLGGPNQFYWDMGDGSVYNSMNVSHVYPADTGNYQIYLWVANEHGCSDSISHSIQVNTDFTVFIPNTFSPNNDGINDVFKIEGRGIVDAELRIYSRWGDEIVFLKNRNALTTGWDGYYKGEEVQQGVYVYFIRVRDPFGEWQEFRGKLNLVR